MTDNPSLSDYLLELRKGAPRERLGIAVGLGAASVAVGLFMGPEYAWLCGAGGALAGICGWAWLSQLADLNENRFAVEQRAWVKQLRLAAIGSLGIAAVGTLLFLVSFFFRFVMLTKVG